MLLLGLAALSVWTLIEVWPVVLLVVTAFIFMAALLPYVDWLCRHGLHRILAVLLMLLLIVALLGGAVALIVPAVVDEFRDVRDNLPDDARDFETFMSDLGFDTENWDLPERAEDIQWNELISGRAAVNVGQRVLFGTLSAITIIVLTAYLLVDTPRLNRFLFQFISAEHQADAREILAALNRVVGGYVRGQLITSLIIGLYTLVVLLIIGVPNAVAFGVLAAFADIIPLVGAFIAIIPPAFAAFQESPPQALIVFVALLAYQQFEDRFLVPRVYGATLNLPALVVLIAVLVGGELLGIPGILLALPAAAAGRVGLDYYLERRRLPGQMPPPKGALVAPDVSTEPVTGIAPPVESGPEQAVPSQAAGPSTGT
jgi:predicted PurR-regulated permease PerM